MYTKETDYGDIEMSSGLLNGLRRCLPKFLLKLVAKYAKISEK